MKNSREEIVPLLASLGCAYSGGPSKEAADPEQTILDCLKFYWISNDVIFMLYGLLNHRIHSLIHVKRLVKLAKSQNLQKDELIVLLVIAEKLIDEGHTQYQMVLNKLQIKGLKMNHPPKGEMSLSLINKWGVDSYFKKYGVQVRSFYEETPKKFHTLKGIFKRNAWLMYRALIGVNFRADIVYMKSSGKATTGYQAQKFTGCAIQPAYKIWNSIQDLEDFVP
jgi:hypothetical protein